MTCVVLAVGAAFTWNVPVLVLSPRAAGEPARLLVFNFKPCARLHGRQREHVHRVHSRRVRRALRSERDRARRPAPAGAGALNPVPRFALTVVRRSVRNAARSRRERGHIHPRHTRPRTAAPPAVLLLYMATAVSRSVGLMSLFATSGSSAGGVLLLVPGLLLLFRAAGSVRGARDSLRGSAATAPSAARSAATSGAFDEMQLRFRNVKCFTDWWEQVCVAAECLACSA